MNKFKNEKGNLLTDGLFWELCIPEKRQACIFTTKDEDIERDGKKYISLKKRYLELEDPTEYEFATTHLDGWKHWKKISTSYSLSKDVEEWREELEVRLRAKGIAGILSEAECGSYNASKYLADKGWAPKRAGKAGAPSKERIVTEALKINKDNNVVDAHYYRMKNKEG